MQKNEGNEAAVKPAEDVVVTLEHPSFGSYTFRSSEDKLEAAIKPAVARAKKEHSVRVGCAQLDKAQNDLQPDLAKCRERIAAFELVNDTAGKAREEKVLERIQAQVQGHAEQRQKLVESLEQ